MLNGKQYMNADEAKGDVFISMSEIEDDGSFQTILQFEKGHLILYADVWLSINVSKCPMYPERATVNGEDLLHKGDGVYVRNDHSEFRTAWVHGKLTILEQGYLYGCWLEVS